MKIAVKVQPRSSQRKLVQNGKGVKVYVQSSPTDGKANEEVREVVAEFYKVKKSAVTIVTGGASRNKIIEIS